MRAAAPQVGDVVEVDRAQCAGEGGRGTVVAVSANGSYSIKYFLPVRCPARLNLSRTENLGTPPAD
jgi:hypothetical protein